ncbi:class I SAM-dependent methyltransferase [Nocardia shimofusensis]|uniref:class I SAM-dependent methyltransferase n=1 Tax=Nocardia shimofusensis TaxID=228596 RepID=UPI0008352C4C|nr:class I SAM-dependent methyltransferase [Nocardia shimofusensis]
MSVDDRQLRAFDTAGSDFQRLAAHLWDPIGAATVAATAPAPGDRVLDACCGTGASAIPAARLIGPGGHLDAIDLSAPLLAELGRNAADLPQIHAHLADATTWPGHGYDIVHAVLGIFFFPDMTAGTRHLISRARPGGRVGLTIWRRGAMEVPGRALRDAVAEVTGTPTPPRPARLLDDINRAEEYRTWLTDQGLREVTVDEHPLHLPVTPELAWLLVTGSGFVGALADLDADRIRAVRQIYLDTLASSSTTHFDATTLVAVGTRVA